LLAPVADVGVGQMRDAMRLTRAGSAHGSAAASAAAEARARRERL